MIFEEGCCEGILDCRAMLLLGEVDIISKYDVGDGSEVFRHELVNSL